MYSGLEEFSKLIVFVLRLTCVPLPSPRSSRMAGSPSQPFQGRLPPFPSCYLKIREIYVVLRHLVALFQQADVLYARARI